MIKPGLYEQLITESLQEELDQIHSRFEIIQSRLDAGESHSVLAQYMEKFLESLLFQAKGPNKINAQIEMCNKLIKLAARELENISDGWPKIRQCGKRLLQIHDPAFARHPKPETPLSVSSLLTATSGDPTLVSQLKQEILHADQVDILVSFIKWSGIRIIKDELEELTKRGKLRIITTSYLGATDLKAIEYLVQLPNTEVRVSCCIPHTLHKTGHFFSESVNRDQ